MYRLSSYIKKYTHIYIFAIICMIISILLNMISPKIVQHIIDDVIILGKQELLFKLLAGILLVGLGRFIFQYLKEFTFDFISSKIASELRKDLFKHIQSLSVPFFDSINTGELMARVKDDVDKIWNSLGYVIMLIIEVIIHTIIIIFCMFNISAKLSIIPCIAMPLVAIIAIIMERRLGNIYGAISDENTILNTIAEEDIAGIRTVKAFSREKYEINKFLSHNKKYYELNMQQSKVFVRYYPYIQCITKLLPIVTIIFGGYLVIKNEISLGELSAFVAYTSNIVWPMEMIGWLTNDFSSALASNKKIKKLMEQQKTTLELEKSVFIDKIDGTIDFNNVCLKIDEEEILKDINFHLEKGKTLGIMGATGSGKTSIINLLQRFYEPQEGEIKVDGINIKSMKIENLRKNMAFVMQDVFLFSDTINENIKLGRKNFIDNKIIKKSCDMAEASNFIEKMDKKYDTVIGERGVGLSGGQKQRISIARALAKETPILIIDDATSALDMETEKLVQKSLNKLKNTTKIIIAHRISSVKNADEIIILDNGKIIERGKHNELLAKKGYYYKTYMAQYGDFVGKEVSICR